MFEKKIKIIHVILKILNLIIPRIERNTLIRVGKKSKSICIVEDAYEFVVEEPEQELAKKRFKASCGPRNVPCFFGILLNDVRLIGSFGLAVTRYGQVITEPIAMNLKEVLRVTIQDLGLIGFFKQYFLAVCPFFDTKKNFLEEGALLYCRATRNVIFNSHVYSSPVFGHWMAEQLPQLRAIEEVIKIKNLNNCKLIINKSPEKWQIESLRLMGHNIDKIIVMPKNGLRVSRLIISSLRSTGSKVNKFEMDPKARQWASKRLQSNYKHINLNNSTLKKNICLFRLDVPSRRIKNIENVRKIININNFTEIKIGKDDLFDSAKDFLYAEKFLYVLGGGVTRIMFSKKLKEIIEIFSCDQDHIDAHFLLASEMGIKYKCIPAAKLPLSVSNKTDENLFYNEHEINEWYLPEEDLVAVLNDKN
jgi:hypothetical protein